MSPSPKELAEAVVRYADEHPAWSQLVNEDRTFEYSERNFPIRVLLGRFTSMQRDRLTAPQFFCWPGMCMTSYRQALDTKTVAALFGEHAALFLNRPDLDVYPRAAPGKDEAILQHLLDEFYAWVSVYEMTRQWLVENGPFEYDYNWLTSKFPSSEMKEWADRHFKTSTGVHPDAFTILK